MDGKRKGEEKGRRKGVKMVSLQFLECPLVFFFVILAIGQNNILNL